MWDDAESLLDDEIRGLFDGMFPEGPDGADVRRDLAAGGEDRIRLAERLGLCLWDVFSDNNDVRGPDGRIAHLGSFRTGGGFLADWMNDRLAVGRFGYLDFYLGTGGLTELDRPEPVYRSIFSRLKGQGGDWDYVFSRLLLVCPFPPDDPGYDPSEAFAREQEEDRLRADIDEWNEDAARRLREGPLPTIVGAYRSVYGHLPRGWPPGGGPSV